MVPAPTLILTGPTGVGKSALAFERALQHDLEIVNADSLLVYRGMDIGTAKPSREERARVPHHLIDIAEPDQSFTAADFVRECERAIGEIHARGKRAMVVGGTGFYLKALLFGLWDAPPADPEIRARLDAESSDALYQRLEEHDREAAHRISRGDRYRLVRALEIFELCGKTPSELEAQVPKEPRPEYSLWVIDRPDEELLQRLGERTQQMIDAGLLDEARSLRERFPNSPRSFKSVGYKQAFDYLDRIPPRGRKISPGLEGLRSEILLATRQLVKSQRTWFRGQKHALNFLLDRDRDALESAFRNWLEKGQGPE